MILIYFKVAYSFMDAIFPKKYATTSVGILYINADYHTADSFTTVELNSIKGRRLRV